jgi:hypothetical protein
LSAAQQAIEDALVRILSERANRPMEMSALAVAAHPKIKEALGMPFGKFLLSRPHKFHFEPRTHVVSLTPTAFAPAAAAAAATELKQQQQRTSFVPTFPYPANAQSTFAHQPTAVFSDPAHYSAPHSVAGAPLLPSGPLLPHATGAAAAIDAAADANANADGSDMELEAGEIAPNRLEVVDTALPPPPPPPLQLQPIQEVPAQWHTAAAASAACAAAAAVDDADTMPDLEPSYEPAFPSSAAAATAGYPSYTPAATAVYAPMMASAAAPVPITGWSSAAAAAQVPAAAMAGGAAPVRGRCRFFQSAAGCARGAHCPLLHVPAGTPAASAAAAPPAAL